MATTNGSAASDNGGAVVGSDGSNIGADIIGDDVSGSDGDGTAGNPRDPASAIKRGRGRPRKDGGESGGGNSSGYSKGNSGTETLGKKPTKLDIELFATQLVGAHVIAAKLLKNPLLEISQKEAESLASAIKNVLMIHKINISPSSLAYLQFIGACLMIYGPRIAIIAAAKQAEREANKNTFDAATGHQV